MLKLAPLLLLALALAACDSSSIDTDVPGGETVWLQ